MKCLILIVICLLHFTACKKLKENTNNCFANTATSRLINNQKAKVSISNNTTYIIEKGPIDTKLLPCNIPSEYNINNLDIIVTGVVKNTLPTNVCCVENFEITKITK